MEYVLRFRHNIELYDIGAYHFSSLSASWLYIFD